MSLWTRILKSIEAVAQGKSFSEVLDELTAPPEKTVAFAIAVIGLSAKMAKADGRVTKNEVAAFRQVFQIDTKDERNAARVFNLARQDVSGYEGYAKSIARMFHNDEPILRDLLEGLFYIATADGVFHELEEQFLIHVSEIFGLEKATFECIRSRAWPEGLENPYAVLGVNPNDSMKTIKTKWQELIKENHPDTMIARGVPVEAIKLAENRLISINKAWEEIKLERSIDA